MDSPKVSIAKGETPFGFVARCVVDCQMPSSVLHPRMVSQVLILGGDGRLHICPATTNDVVAGSNQVLCVRDRLLVDAIFGHGWCLPMGEPHTRPPKGCRIGLCRGARRLHGAALDVLFGGGHWRVDAKRAHQGLGVVVLGGSAPNETAPAAGLYFSRSTTFVGGVTSRA